ncbi:ACT domain-containing protein [Limosilactobacillus sp.]|uniref:ACT domain-containing protein n=1 Tax=Limosilactobacillus sp. TaxID=2773925 RepID=UPI00345EB6F1
MKAILTTIGKDKPGIVAGVSAFLASQEINILDISQTIMDGNFTMMMMVQLDENQDFNQLIEQLNQLGKKLDVDINVRNEALYNAMHQL